MANHLWIIIQGPPGSGKTAVGALVAKALRDAGLPVQNYDGDMYSPAMTDERQAVAAQELARRGTIALLKVTEGT